MPCIVYANQNTPEYTLILVVVFAFDPSQKIFTSYLAAVRALVFGAVYVGFVSFAGGILKMIRDQRARKDKEKAMAASSAASDVGVSGAGAVSNRAPFCGGPAYPVDAKLDAFEREVRMLELKVRKQAALDALGGCDSEGGAAAGAGAGPAVTGPASDKKKEDSGSGSSSSRMGMKYNKVRACCFSV